MQFLLDDSEANLETCLSGPFDRNFRSHSHAFRLGRNARTGQPDAAGNRPGRLGQRDATQVFQGIIFFASRTFPLTLAAQLATVRLFLFEPALLDGVFDLNPAILDLIEEQVRWDINLLKHSTAFANRARR